MVMSFLRVEWWSVLERSDFFDSEEAVREGDLMRLVARECVGSKKSVILELCDGAARKVVGEDRLASCGQGKQSPAKILETLGF
jgi:hypothetical protein